MPLSQDRCTQVIAEHSAAFAGLVEGHLDAEIEFCPGWTVRDVVHHLTQVHWFWATIVEDGIVEQPDDLQRPEPAPDEMILVTFRAGADRLVRVLGEADPAARVWTWAPEHQDAAFVIRHQVQEVVGHHWDLAHATGRRITVAPDVGADAVDEFLHVSVSSPADPAEPLPPPLGGRFALSCVDSSAAWVVSDGDPAGTVVVEPVSAELLAHEPIPSVTGTGGQLLLWLYDRHGDPSGDADARAVDPGLLRRFRAMCFTG